MSSSDYSKHTTALLQKLQYPEFSPVLPFVTGWSQTLAGRYWPQFSEIPYDNAHELELPDGDRLMIMENRPVSWQPGDRIVVLIHGLTGCYQSRYMIRLCRLFMAEGWLVIRVNLRGCGPGAGMARNIYHSGRSEDSRAVLNWLAGMFPDSPTTLIGFSLGGNLSLKMAGEDGDSPSGNMDSLMAVSPPVNLARSCEILREPRNQLFDQHFVAELREHVHQLHQRFPDLPKPELPSYLTVYTFDDHYTAPCNGFHDALDYYQRSSSGPLLEKIRVPTLILCSMDDPVIHGESMLEYLDIPGLDLVLTKHGGHVGFVGRSGHDSGFRWMDGLLLRWLQRHHAQR
ncbi:MAG: alpha/beta fold hydrolase [SAR324 cluster bacterium]|nr:alpha/beta fold hydrolase [SAR324 cluster bacterium]